MGPKKIFSEIVQSSHRVVSTDHILFKSNDVKSGCINYLPLGSQICVKDFDDFWAKVYIGNNQNRGCLHTKETHLKMVKKLIIG